MAVPPGVEASTTFPTPPNVESPQNTAQVAYESSAAYYASSGPKHKGRLSVAVALAS